jgi:hypothetical protein
VARDPYCRNCNYSLKGLTESSKCPECGKPIVEVLERGPMILPGRRYSSKTVIFGLPLVQIATGPYEKERYGRARGIIAIGDVATGWLAIGGFARGLIAFGGFALGLAAFGGGAIGLIAAGGLALCAAGYGGLTAGAVVSGGLAAGYVVVSAGLAFGYYARGGMLFAIHGIGAAQRDAEAISFFNDHAWLFGGVTGFGYAAWLGVATFVFAVLLFLLAMAGYVAGTRATNRDASQMR